MPGKHVLRQQAACNGIQHTGRRDICHYVRLGVLRYRIKQLDFAFACVDIYGSGMLGFSTKR